MREVGKGPITGGRWSLKVASVIVRVRLAAVRQGSDGARTRVRGGNVVQSKKVALFVGVVFVLYVIITDPKTAADYVQIGFEGVSSAAQSIGDFMTWVVNGGK